MDLKNGSHKLGIQVTGRMFRSTVMNFKHAALNRTASTVVPPHQAATYHFRFRRSKHLKRSKILQSPIAHSFHPSSPMLTPRGGSCTVSNSGPSCSLKNSVAKPPGTVKRCPAVEPAILITKWMHALKIGKLDVPFIGGETTITL